MRPEKIHKSVAAEEKEEAAAATAVVPSFFKCPISLELMRDPVVLCTGQSYERSSIEPWLEAGNHTCPATMQTLASLELVPNHTLRRLIQNWCEAHGGGGSSSALIRLLSTPSVPVAVDTVARMLREVQSSVDPLPSLKNIRSVARESERNRKCIQESDAVSVLASVINGALELRCEMDSSYVLGLRGFQTRPGDADLRDGGSISHLRLLCAGTGPAVPQDQHLSDASEGEKVSTGRVTTSTMEGAKNIHLPHQSRRSGLGFPQDSTEKLLGELESTLEKVADMESQIKTMKHYATDSNANKKSSEVELEEWIDGDYENQVIACMEITELRRQLHSQESEYKSLVRSCKVKEHLEATRGPMRAWIM